MHEWLTNIPTLPTKKKDTSTRLENYKQVALRITLCRYVSEFFGKSKLITTFTAWISIPLVNRSVEQKQNNSVSAHTAVSMTTSHINLYNHMECNIQWLVTSKFKQSRINPKNKIHITNLEICSPQSKKTGQLLHTYAHKLCFSLLALK